MMLIAGGAGFGIGAVEECVVHAVSETAKRASFQLVIEFLRGCAGGTILSCAPNLERWYEKLMTNTMRNAACAAVFVILTASCLDAQTGRKSQLASVTQLVGPAKIEIVYRRPVARGRELFGSLVPFGRIWTPSADSAAVMSTSTDLDVNGSRLKAGRYAIWMIPDSTEWTVVFSSAQPVFHLKKPDKDDEVLRVKARPHQAEHMETLGFYFPMVDDDSATLNMHWGRTVVPLNIKSR